MTKTTPSSLPEFPDCLHPLRSRAPTYHSQLLAPSYLHLDNLANTRDFSRAQVAIIFPTKHTFPSPVTNYSSPRPWRVIGFLQELIPICFFPSACPCQQITSTAVSSSRTKSKPTALQECNRLLTGLSPNIRFKSLPIPLLPHPLA